MTSRQGPQRDDWAWFLLHLGLGLSWCALLASRAPGGSGPGASGVQVFLMLMAAGWLASGSGQVEAATSPPAISALE
jgi:hypothetical protein